MKQIFIATPCYAAMVTQQYTASIVKLLKDARGLDVRVGLLGGDSLITRARNTLVAQFLGTDADYLFFIDADIEFNVEQVHAMVEFDQDFVAGLYPLKTYMKGRLCYVGKPEEEPEQRGRFVTGEYVGTGFMCLKRKAIQKIVENCKSYTDAHAYAHGSIKEDGYEVFETGIYKGVYLSEDFMFCKKWRDMGGTIWLDMQGKLNHVGVHMFCGNPAV